MQTQDDLNLLTLLMLEITFSLDAAHLTHCRLNRLSNTIYSKSPISILCTPGYEMYIFLEKSEPLANSGDPDQTPRSAASDLGLHCLPITILRVSRLQWVNLMKAFQI